MNLLIIFWGADRCCHLLCLSASLHLYFGSQTFPLYARHTTPFLSYKLNSNSNQKLPYWVFEILKTSLLKTRNSQSSTSFPHASFLYLEPLRKARFLWSVVPFLGHFCFYLQSASPSTFHLAFIRVISWKGPADLPFSTVSRPLSAVVSLVLSMTLF